MMAADTVVFPTPLAAPAMTMAFMRAPPPDTAESTGSAAGGHVQPGGSSNFSAVAAESYRERVPDAQSGPGFPDL